ncbi:MAG: HEAT repeat domain-containing protein [Chloroflexi bacterium]|nr:HEAT repeat domain-containing protein [Chloroflexota bacterium]
MEELDSNQSEISFDEVIAALQDESNPFPARYLYRLSGLESEELGLLTRIWPDLSTTRRLGLLEDMEMLADSNTVMHFDAVNRIALGDEDARVRLTAVRSLWPAEQPALVPKLFDLLDHDENPEVRAQAAASLGRFVYLGEVGKIPEGTLKQIEERLLEAMESDEDELVQRRALESLGYSSRAEVSDLIEEAYESDDDEWIASALFAMGRSADDRWAPLVIERLNDSNVELSREAARAAGELELGEALPALVDLLHDEDSELRLAAAWALSQIGGNGVAEALEELLERTDDEDEIDLVENAIENLALTQEIGDLNLLDFSPEDLEDLAQPNSDSLDDEDPATQ